MSNKLIVVGVGNSPELKSKLLEAIDKGFEVVFCGQKGCELTSPTEIIRGINVQPIKLPKFKKTRGEKRADKRKKRNGK